MRKKKKWLGEILPQILLQSALIIVTAIASFMFMTWLVQGVFGITDTYVAAGYESLGTLITFIIILVPLNTIAFRRRINEINTLSNAIQRVVHGDYSTHIDCSKNHQMAS